jgi:hypothetical protein
MSMLHFKSTADLKQLSANHPAYPLIKDLVERLIMDFPPHRAYAPDDDGWICLIEETDVDRVPNEEKDEWTLRPSFKTAG